MYKPNPREAAMLLLHALKQKGDQRGKPLTRARLSRLTLNRLWNREQLNEAWMRDVNEWLLSAGWLLINAEATYGVVKTSVIENWPRVASKHIEDLDRVGRGNFVFSNLEPLLQTEAHTQPATASAAKPSHSRKRRKPLGSVSQRIVKGIGRDEGYR
jgi:hypothetical protein